MVTLCWAVKGGSGTTVVAAVLALGSPRPSLIVDLDGELPAVLGIAEPDRPGVAEWLASEAPSAQLADLLVDVAPRTWLLPWQAARAARDRDDESYRWTDLGEWMNDWSAQWGCDVVVDVGTRVPPGGLSDLADRSLLVTRPCYLGLHRAVQCTVRPSGVILVDEPGRGLARRDVEHALGVPVEATISVDPAVARAVDAGLLASRLPRVIARELRAAAA